MLLTGTLGAVRGMAGNMGYCVSKHATLGLARTVAMEVAPPGRALQLPAPRLHRHSDDEWRPGRGWSQRWSRPRRKAGSAVPKKPARVAAFLLSDDASHVTGQELAVDGGCAGDSGDPVTG